MNTVSIVRCEEYELDQVRAALKRSLENIGGLGCYISRGERVLLKVNLVMKKVPEAAATSHPVFVQALAELLMEEGITVLVGDSPGGPFNEAALRSIYKVCGMTEMAQRCGAELSYNTGSREVSNPEGLLLQRLTNIDMLREVDHVICVSKLKTHGMMKLTGAVKNMFGTVPGIMKAEYHLNRPEVTQFADGLIDICLCAHPILSFIDGIVGMEGNGPTAGTPRRLSVILASPDPFDLDFVAATVVGMTPESVPTVERSIQRGLCAGSLERIGLVGDPLAEFAVSDFKAPEVKDINPLRKKVPGFALHFVNRTCQPRPKFLHDRCIGCEDCCRSCPPGAIRMKNGRPEVELDKCIRCFCCQELCPCKAVEIKKPVLFRLLTKSF